jgi:hypothetical protein
MKRPILKNENGQKNAVSKVFCDEHRRGSPSPFASQRAIHVSRVAAGQVSVSSSTHFRAEVVGLISVESESGEGGFRKAPESPRLPETPMVQERSR